MPLVVRRFAGRVAHVELHVVRPAHRSNRQGFESTRSSVPNSSAPVGWQSHFSHLDKVENNFYQRSGYQQPRYGPQVRMGCDLPPADTAAAAEEKFRPQDAHEQAWLAEWSAPLNLNEPESNAARED